jgi:hypothetical protein
VNPNKIIGWFLLILLIPFIVEQAVVLAKDPWAIEQTSFLFVGAPKVHNMTLFILSIMVLLLWFTSKFNNVILRIEAVSIRSFCAVCFYEVIWHFANGIKIGNMYIFTWQWWLNFNDLISGFQILTIIAIIFLIIHNKINKMKFNHVTAFIALLTIFIIAFLVQGLLALDWSPEAIRYNVPYLWLATKLIGYLMWIFV